MADLVHDLYQSRAYAAMSHPLADPAISSVAAVLGGLRPPDPRRATILEIGCNAGHHLIPLARRWPDSRFIGIDLAESAIAEARSRALVSRAGNVEFQVADLRNFNPPDRPFDFIIAHGFFSWVPDEVKSALFAFCRKHLSPYGIATICFNVSAGWQPRLPVIAKVRAIQHAAGSDEMLALAALRDLVDPGDPEHAIIQDMLAKGPGILPFDDFAPVNDPWPADRFARAAFSAGLRWLGESDPAANVPHCIPPTRVGELQSTSANPLEFMQAVDLEIGRTLRSGVLCRVDAPISGRISSAAILDLAVHAAAEDSDEGEIVAFVRQAFPRCLVVREIASRLNHLSPATVVQQVYQGILRGSLKPRIEPVSYSALPEEFPKLDSFRLLCAAGSLPLVDVWHVPCAFPAEHYQILAAMDGSRSRDELTRLAARLSPRLAFDPWLDHLTQRGMFS